MVLSDPACSLLRFSNTDDTGWGAVRPLHSHRFIVGFSVRSRSDDSCREAEGKEKVPKLVESGTWGTRKSSVSPSSGTIVLVPGDYSRLITLLQP
jgi:hypothetical protein